MPPEISASQAIAHWASSQTVPAIGPDLVHFARRTLLDTVAVALAGRHEAASRLIVRHAEEAASTRIGATIWSEGTHCAPETAALVNGTMSHVLDYDDVSSPQRGHPSVVLWPAIAALAESRGIAEGRAMAAYVIGLEIIAKLGRLMAIDHVAKGWHSTPTLGVLGATIGCCWLLDLPAVAMANAVGIGFAHAAGSRENFGTMSKSLQAGIAAAAAVRATQLASIGFEASRHALDGEAGFVHLYGKGESFSDILSGLGQPFEAVLSAVDVKRYPACYATHRTIDGMRALREAHGLTLDNVARVDVVASNKASLALVHDRPATPLEAKFSMQYAVATVLADGTVNLHSFQPEAVTRPAVQSFLPTVTSREADGPVLPRRADITVTMHDGRVFRTRVESLHGSAENPLSDSELSAKVTDCVSFAGIGIHPEILCNSILNPTTGPLNLRFPGYWLPTKSG